MAATRMTTTHLMTVLLAASVCRAAGLAILLLVEALGIDGAGRRRKTDKEGQDDECGSNGLHGILHLLSVPDDISAARQQ